MDVALFTDQVRDRERSLYRIAYSYLHNDADAADAPALGAILALPRPVRRAALGHEHFVDPALPRPRRRADVLHDVLEGVA